MTDSFSDRKIHGFDISTPGTYGPLGSPEHPFFPISHVEGGFEGSDISVDNSALGSAGNIYFVSSSTNRLYGFDPNGVALGGNFPTAPKTQTCGTAVDSAGTVWVVERTARRARKYDSAGNDLGSVDVSAAGFPCQVAFDRTNGDMYVANRNGATRRFTAASNYGASTQIDGGSAAALAFDSMRRVLYVAHASDVTAYTPSGGQIEQFATGIGGERFEGVAVDEATGSIYLSQRSPGRVSVFPAFIIPDVTTGDSSGLTTVNGQVDPAGGGEVTDCYFEFGTTTAYGSSEPCTPGIPPNYSSPTDVSATLPGLTGGVTYHYRLVASNAEGTNVGEDRTFTPFFVEDLTTEPPTDVTKTSATLNASFTGDGDDTHYYFEWGTDTSYGNLTAVPPGEAADSPTGPTQVSAGIEGLEMNLPTSTPYHFRVVVTNSLGTTLSEDRIFFAAPPDPPTVSSPVVSNLGPTTATLSTSINPDLGDTVYQVEYGTDPSYGFTTEFSEPIGGDDSDHPVSVDLAALQPGVIYHYRFVAINFGGTTLGPNRTFTTPGLPGPPPLSPPAPPALALPDTNPKPPVNRGCVRLARRAKLNSNKAKRLRRVARASKNPPRARALSKRARSQAQTAKRLSNRAKACRRGNRRNAW